jgi:hypothetical protein
VAAEAFDPAGTKLSDAAKVYAARLPAAPHAAFDRYQDLQRLDPPLPDVDKAWAAHMYRVDGKYAAAQKQSSLSFGDFWVPDHLTALPPQLSHAFPTSRHTTGDALASGAGMMVFDSLDAHAALVGFEAGFKEGAAPSGDFQEW